MCLRYIEYATALAIDDLVDWDLYEESLEDGSLREEIESIMASLISHVSSHLVVDGDRRVVCIIIDLLNGEQRYAEVANLRADDGCERMFAAALKADVPYSSCPSSPIIFVQGNWSFPGKNLIGLKSSIASKCKSFASLKKGWNSERPIVGHED